jgi:ABC-type dipeptide/oligopeptide/nickel transport system permease subunit
VSTIDLAHQTEADTVDVTAAEGTAAIAARSPFELFWRRLRDDRVALTALGFIAVIILVAIFAPLIVKLVGAPGPTVQNPNALDSFGTPTGPSSKHLFGVDGLGRDVFSRTLYGAQVSMEVAFISTGLAVMIGVSAGMIAGYYRGWVDTAISRLIDVLLAFPILLLGLGLGAACSFGNGCITVNKSTLGLVLLLIGVAVALLSVAAPYVTSTFRKVSSAEIRQDRTGTIAGIGLGVIIGIIGAALTIFGGGRGGLIQPGKTVVIFIIIIASWPYIARIIRGQTLSLREKEFVEAARSLGASNARIVFREILPNLVAPIIVYASLILPTNILFEAALSFLGVGIQPPNSSWGQMIADATGIFDTAWWYMLFPGLALLLTVLAFNLVGDGLQDALNPRSGK